MTAEIIEFPLNRTMGVALRRAGAAGIGAAMIDNAPENRWVIEQAIEKERLMLQIAAMVPVREKPVAEVVEALCRLAESLPWRFEKVMAYVKDRVMAGMPFDKAVRSPRLVSGVWIVPEAFE